VVRVLIVAFTACVTLALAYPFKFADAGTLHPDVQQLRGVSLHPEASDANVAILSREFKMLQRAGASSVRFDVFWATLEWKERGQYVPSTLRRLDRVFKLARADHLKVILDLWATPCWASSAPIWVKLGCSPGWWRRNVTHYPPVRAEDYAAAAGFVARRWRRSIVALELWNEPNGGQFFTSSDPASDYARLVRAAYPVIKSVAPKLPVIMSLGGTDTTFLGKLYSHGVMGYYDGIAVHPYGQPHLGGLRAFHAYQQGHGDQTPLWVTEVGWSSAVSGLEGQAEGVASALTQLAVLRYVRAVEIYEMRDGGAPNSSPEDHFGLVKGNLRPKPAWWTFVKTLRELAR